MVPRGASGAVKHRFRGGIGTGYGRQLSVGPVAVDGKNLGLRHRDELREGAVEIRGHPDIVHRAKTVRAHAGTYENTLSKKRFITVLAKRHNNPAAVGTLNDREWCRLVPAAIRLVLG